MQEEKILFLLFTINSDIIIKTEYDRLGQIWEPMRLDFFQKSDKVSALIFWENPIWGFLKYRAKREFWQMGQCRNFHFVRRVYRGRSPLCRECKGAQLHAGVKGQSPLSGQGWNALPSDLMPASSRTGYYLANCVTQNHFRGWPPHEKSLWNARGR